MEEWKLSWMAGVLESEGTITIRRIAASGRKANFSYHVQVTVVNTDSEMVNPFKLAFGGSCRLRPNGKNRKPIYVWVVASRKAETALLMLLPFLRTARHTELARVCLAFLETRRNFPIQKNAAGRVLVSSPDYIAVQEEAYQICKRLNQRGETKVSRKLLDTLKQGPKNSLSETLTRFRQELNLSVEAERLALKLALGIVTSRSRLEPLAAASLYAAVLQLGTVLSLKQISEQTSVGRATIERYLYRLGVHMEKGNYSEKRDIRIPKILELAREPATVIEMATRLQIPRNSLYKTLKSLVDDGRLSVYDSVSTKISGLRSYKRTRYYSGTTSRSKLLA